MSERDSRQDGEADGTGASASPEAPRPKGGLWGRRDRITRRARIGAKQVVRRQVPGGARYAFRIDFTAMLLAGLYTGAVFPFINVIARDDLGASENVLAWITAAPFLGNLMALFWARAMEGRRKIPFVKWSHIGARSMVMMTFFASGAGSFALVVSLCQVIGTIATPAYASIIKEVYPDDQRGRILGITRAAILGAQVASTLIAGWLLGVVGYQIVFPVAALLGIASALIFSRILNEDDVEAARPAAGEGPGLKEKFSETWEFIRSTFHILWEDDAYRWFAMSVFTYGFGNLMTVPLIPVIQVDELHIQKSELALLSNLSQLVAMIFFFYWGRFVDRRSPQRAVVVNIMLNTLIPLVYIGTAWFPGASAWVLLPAFVISGVVMAGIDLSYFNALLSFSGPEKVSRYQALQSFLLGMRGSVAPFLGSALAHVLRAHQLNLRYAFALSIVFMLAGAWMQLVAARKQESRRLVLDIG